MGDLLTGKFFVVLDDDAIPFKSGQIAGPVGADHYLLLCEWHRENEGETNIPYCCVVARSDFSVKNFKDPFTAGGLSWLFFETQKHLDAWTDDVFEIDEDIVENDQGAGGEMKH